MSDLPPGHKIVTGGCFIVGFKYTGMVHQEAYQMIIKDLDGFSRQQYPFQVDFSRLSHFMLFYTQTWELMNRMYSYVPSKDLLHSAAVQL